MPATLYPIVKEIIPDTSARMRGPHMREPQRDACNLGPRVREDDGLGVSEDCVLYPIRLYHGWCGNTGW
jgi:hypothetical protein